RTLSAGVDLFGGLGGNCTASPQQVTTGYLPKYGPLQWGPTCHIHTIRPHWCLAPIRLGSIRVFAAAGFKPNWRQRRARNVFISMAGNLTVTGVSGTVGITSAVRVTSAAEVCRPRSRGFRDFLVVAADEVPKH